MLRNIARLSPGLRSWTLAAPTTRAYHSYDHEEQFTDRESPKYRILLKAMDFVPKHGFQHKAILDSSRTFGYSDAIQTMFTNGTFDLIKFHLIRERLKLQEYLQLPEFTQLSELDKVKYLVKKRLEGNIPYADHITQLQTYLVLPPNVAQSSEELHNLSDDIRFFSGDASNDFAWYTKRLSLSSTYVALELFMSQDKSPNFQKTMELADKRVGSIGDFGQMYTDAEEFLSYTLASGANVVKSQLSRG